MAELLRFSRRVVGVVALSAALMFGALLTSASAADMKVRFIMPTGPATYLLPFFVAQDLGWYEKWGLTVDEKVVRGDPNSIRAVISGDGDVTVVGPNTAMQTIIKGGGIKAISSWQPITDYHIITRPEVGTSLKELSDKKWAAYSSGGMSAEIPKMVLRKHGFSADAAKILAVGGMSSRMQEGRSSPWSTDVFYREIGKQQGLVRDRRDCQRISRTWGYLYAVTSEKNLKDADMRKAIKILRSRRHSKDRASTIMKNPDQAAEVMKKRTPDVDMGLIKNIIHALNDQDVWGANARISRPRTGKANRDHRLHATANSR